MIDKRSLVFVGKTISIDHDRGKRKLTQTVMNVLIETFFFSSKMPSEKVDTNVKNARKSLHLRICDFPQLQDRSQSNGNGEWHRPYPLTSRFDIPALIEIG
jgi:hypothetical protein